MVRGERLYLPWLALSAACVGWMWAVPGEEVIPYHLIWIGFALAYGFEAWPRRRAAVSLAVVGAASGGVLLARARAGRISWDEAFEIPLMLVLSGLVMWHVQRRDAALRRAEGEARRRAAEAARRDRLGRLSSHEMRTPLTIATGYVHVLAGQETDPARMARLDVVSDELARLGRAADRLLRMIQLHDSLPRTWIGVRPLLEETARRWSSVATRNWVVEPGADRLYASPERVRACIDTLVENSVRYTDEGDTIRLFARDHGDDLWLGIADSGPGLAPEQVARVNALDGTAPPDPHDPSPDPLSQTGLGIGLVREIVEARQGRLLAGRAREGGALFVVRLPRFPGPGGPT